MATAHSEIRDAVRTTAQEFFADRVTRESLDESEAGGFARALWNEAAELGLASAALPEEQGGLGSLRDACVILRPAGYHAAPLPLAEALLAGWLGARAGLALPEGLVTVATGLIDLAKQGDGFSVSGTLTAVPWGRSADMLAALGTFDGQNHLVLAPLEGATVKRAHNLAAEPRDTVTLKDAASIAAAPIDMTSDRLRVILAAMRATQMAGALERILDLAVSYANERQQFGKPIGKFQAIQQQIAVLANHTAASIMAVERAVSTIEEAAVERLGAIAKVRAGEGASEGVRIAHQVHGAMGFTHEHILHHLTRRLWSWRDEYGSESHWARKLGAAVIAGGADDLWNFVGEAA